VNNTIDFLTIENSLGLTLNGDFTINQGIALVAGNFAIGPNTLTFNGIVTAMTGSVTGGSSTNMIIGGTGGVISMPAFILNNLTINRASGVDLYGDVTIAGTLTLTNGILAVGANTLTLSNSPAVTIGAIDASNAGATLIFANAASIVLPASFFTGVVNNLTIEGAGGITSAGDFTVNGVLHLQSANPSATRGCLDMLDGTVLKTLTMGADATTTGTGDVTGIVKRTSFVVNNAYSFGNQFTTITLAAGGELPSTVSVKIVLSPVHTWKPDAINRYYDITRTGGTSSTLVTLNLHYLVSELNGAIEGNLDLFDYHQTTIPPHLDDHGRSNENITDKWVGLGNLTLTYAARLSFDSKYWTLGTSTATNFTWVGATTDWNSGFNWTGGVVPASGNHAVIPDAGTTPNDPELPATATVGYILIQAGGILNGGTGTVLTIDGSAGAWDNMGTFNPGTSTVIFTNAAATMADPTNFYNVTVADGAKLTLGTDNIMRIAGTLSRSTSGILNAALNHNTIEYNGADQTIILPNGSTPGYHNLILSGSGIKTMPTTAMKVAGNLTLSDITSVTAGNDMTIAGSATIGGDATLVTGNYSHSIGRNFENNGTFMATAGSTILMNGEAAQSITGTSGMSFDNLTINNSHGVNLFSDVNVNNLLDLSGGNLNIGATTLGINGTISKSAGFLDVNTYSSLNVGGSASLTIPNNLFASAPAINNFTVNRSGGVTLGNQDMTVHGLLHLPSGTFSLGANTLTIDGSSPTRTAGDIDASNAGLILNFTNTNPIILPGSIFAGAVNNLTINGAGGITSNGDFTINGILHLQSANPSAIKGSLDMWDGSAMKTLTMGPNATTIGIGDVTGIVRRTSFDVNTPYSFGNQFTTITFYTGGTRPTELKAKIIIGASPAWKPEAINRIYDFVQAGGSGCLATIATHYLDTELNGLIENELVQWTFGVPPQQPEVAYAWGRSNSSQADNWVEIANVDIGYFPTSFGQLENTLAKSLETICTWNGSQSTSWTTVGNWSPASIPVYNSYVVIPDASTTLFSPVLPADNRELKSLNIETAGVLNSEAGAQLTLNGANNAWCNTGTFNHNTSNVIFTNAAATICGTTNFNDVTINAGKILTMTGGTTMRIAGTLTNNGILRTVIGGPTTVEYNGGNQTVVVPNPATNRYFTLVLSGTGTKTMPASALSVYGNFMMSGAANAAAGNDMTIAGSAIIGEDATLVTGSYSHAVGGNFENNGATINTAGSTLTFNGTSAQIIGGTSSTIFNNLTLDNSSGVSLEHAEYINGVLTFSNGKISLGAYDLLLGPSAIISGSDNAKYLITDGPGALSQRVPASATDVNYPIGVASEYLPVTVRLTAASTVDEIKARVAEGLNTSYDAYDIPTGNAITDHVVLRTWYLKESVAGGSDATVTTQWNAGSEASNFNRNMSNLAHYSGGAWQYATSSAASGSDPYVQTVSGITSFSPFGVFGQTISCTLSGTAFCAGTPVTVNYTASGVTWEPGNVFTAQLSDASGGFSSPVNIGTVASQASGSISATLPLETIQGAAYRIRVVSSNPAFSGTQNADDLTINAPSYVGTAPTVADLQATGTDIKWYDVSTGGTPLAATVELANGHHYYASQTVNGCESTARFEVIANVDPTPCAPTGNAEQPFCIAGNHTVGELVVTGQNPRWYNAASGGALLPASTVLTAGEYWATQTISCTESASRFKVTVTNHCP
jgi:hypothetical protein